MHPSSTAVLATTDPEPSAAHGLELGVETLLDGRVRRARLERSERGSWRVEFEAESFFLKDAVGLHYLGFLLANPYRRVPALAIPEGAGRSCPRQTKAGDGPAAWLRSPLASTHRRTLASLDDQLEEAERHGDRHRSAALREEISTFAESLVRAMGSSKSPSSPAEMARKRVTNAIRRVLERIERHSPALAEHLSATVRTGASFSYRPDPLSRVRWSCPDSPALRDAALR